MTGEGAARRAAAILDKAESAVTGEERQALCAVAEGWRRLAETLAAHPSLETHLKVHGFHQSGWRRAQERISSLLGSTPMF